MAVRNEAPTELHVDCFDSNNTTNVSLLSDTESDSDSDLHAAISASLTDSWYDDSARFMTCDYVHPFYLLNFIILQTNSLLSQFLYVILSYVCQQAGASEQFLNGTSAHNRPFQCQYMVLRLKTTYT